MDKEVIRQKINELTFRKDWEDHDEIATEAKKLGKLLWNWQEKQKRRTSRKIAIWCGDRILATGTAEELSKITGLSKNIIWNRAKSLQIDAKGRQFKYMEDSK